MLRVAVNPKLNQSQIRPINGGMRVVRQTSGLRIMDGGVAPLTALIVRGAVDHGFDRAVVLSVF